MPTLTITLPQELKDELDFIPKTGYYDNKSEFIRDAIRSLLRERNDIRIATAIEMYKGGFISISKAAEISNLNFKEMIVQLKDRGIPILCDEENVDEKVEYLKKLME